MSLLKKSLLWLLKLTGILRLSRKITASRLRILCYHGLAFADENKFRPGVFTTDSILATRIDFLLKQGYRFESLHEALAKLKSGRLADNTIVLTFDDGWYSTYSRALPIMAERNIPWTLYVTSYFVEKSTPVLNMLIDYMFWKSPVDDADLSASGVPSFIRHSSIPIHTDSEIQSAATIAKDFVNQFADDEARLAIVRSIADSLQVDVEQVIRDRMFDLCSIEELKEMERQGVDIQLHTHRHRLPEDESEAIREIMDNKNVLEPVLGRTLTHFCYPSGDWSLSHWPALEACGIQSATTCDPGLVSANTHRFALKRILDSYDMSQIEFEAAVSGVKVFLATLKEKLLPFHTTAQRRCKTNPTGANRNV